MAAGGPTKLPETTQDAVRTFIRGGVGKIVIDRPARRNALDHATVVRLRHAVEALSADDRLRCLVLTGTPGAFCAGADLREAAQGLDGDPAAWFRTTIDELHPVIDRLHRGGKAVVTSMGGPVAGGGLGLALVGDIRLASSDASFRSAYLRLGLSPDGACTYFLTRLAGLATAQRFLLLDHPMDAEEARRNGFVHFVLPPGDLDAEADRIADALAALPVGSVQAARRLLLSAGHAQAGDQMEREKDLLLELATRADAKEGILAFLEKRPPRFA